MKRYFEFKEENRKSVIEGIKSINIPRVISNITRKNTEVWSLNIEGSDSDVPLFIEQLEELNLPIW